MKSDDAPAVARLCGVLGYPSEPEAVSRRFAGITAAQGHGLFVATSKQGRVVGWIHIYGVKLLESDPFAEIGGLVVDTDLRGCGIGSDLMSGAEQWAREQGYDEVRLRSNITRTQAHEFYRSLGYKAEKTSYTFRKVLWDNYGQNGLFTSEVERTDT